MELDHTLKRLKKLLIERTGTKEQLIEPSAKLFEDLGLDSLDAFELGMAIEDEFGVDIADSELKQLKTVEEAAKLILCRLPETGSDKGQHPG